MRAYAYSGATPPPGEYLTPGWLEEFRALYFVHCLKCGHLWAIECAGKATVWRMGSIGKCREIEVELSCPQCHVHISVLWSYPLDKLPKTPSRDQIIRELVSPLERQDEIQNEIRRLSSGYSSTDSGGLNAIPD